MVISLKRVHYTYKGIKKTLRDVKVIPGVNFDSDHRL
jgi:hypothetical protein